MLKNELFKYTPIRYELAQYILSALSLCVLLSVLSVLNTSAVHASSLCADLVSSSSSKEQSTQTDFGFGSESTSRGKNTLPLPSSSSKNTSESSSSNILEPSLTSNALDFYANSEPPKEGTRNFQSYIGELLEKQIIKEPQFTRFIKNLERGELINPISKEEALTSTALLVQRNGLQKYLDQSSLNQKELLAWSRATLEKRARVRVSREETQEETKEIYQKLEFHPVKRPARFEMRDDGDKALVILTYPTEVQSTPVTQDQWVEIMGENPSHFAKGEDSVVRTFHGKSIDLQPDNPVENVTWWSVLEFANRLSEQHGFPPAYDLSDIIWEPGTRAEDGTLMPVWKQMDGNKIRIYAEGKSHKPSRGDNYYHAEGYRLPTMAEYEYMLQKGGRGEYPNEADLAKHAWYKDNADSRTHPVGLLQPMVIDGKDFHELYGNVKEMLWDQYRFEHQRRLKSEKNPVDATGYPSTSGGNWSEELSNAYVYRKLYLNIKQNSVGFRLVRTIKKGDGE